MKKVLIYFIFFISIFIPINVSAQDKVTVKFSACVDGDTAKVKLNSKEIKIRFLAVDTPETKHPTKGEEPYGKEASEYTCKKLKQAKKIELEYDSNSDKKDKYNRHLVWVFIDNSLLQAELIKKGYATTAYLYDDYKYTSLLEDYETTARINKVGLHSEEDNSYYTKNKNSKEKSEEKDDDSIEYYIKKLLAKILDEIFK